VWNTPAIHAYTAAKAKLMKTLPKAKAESLWHEAPHPNKTMGEEVENYYACKYLSHFTTPGFGFGNSDLCFN